MRWRRKWQPTPVFLPGESRGRGSLVGCCLWSRTELDMTDVTSQTKTKKMVSSKDVGSECVPPLVSAVLDIWEREISLGWLVKYSWR